MSIHTCLSIQLGCTGRDGINGHNGDSFANIRLAIRAIRYSESYGHCWHHHSEAYQHC